MSWHGRILRANLTHGTMVAEPLNMEWARDYLGQRGLGTKYLHEEVDPAVDALASENKLIFATGPLTGTAASTGGRYSVITKGPLTGAIACSNSGGKFGAELRLAGYDMLIIEGRAPRPVYLYIRNDEAQILPADEFWGQTVWVTEPGLQQRHQDPRIKVASIGRAGEYGNRFACVVNDLHRAAGRSGVGAVMGSKQLKAIAVRGTRGCNVKDPERFSEVAARTHREMRANPDRAGMTRYGTIMMVDVTQNFGTLPTRNNRDVQFEGADRINAQAMHTPNAGGHTNLIGHGACFACTIACGRLCHIDPNHFSVRSKPQYHIASGGLEYETAYALGAAVGVGDIDAATYCGFLCNEDGMDPISLGGTIAAAMELFGIGAISTRETGGIELRFGNAEALVGVTELTARGEGFGRDIGLGSLRLCRKYGHPELSMSVKGQEFAAYDGRTMQGMGLGYATSNRGACHLRASTYTSDFESTDWRVKPGVCKDTQDDIAAVDSSGLCLFTGELGLSFERFAEHVDAACDGEWDVARLRATGERIWNLERQFNLRAGFTAADDTLPGRMLSEPAPSGTAKGLVSRLDLMLPEYYRLRGWDSNGVPTAETLQRLGLR
ncbi:MAG: aldehyde ferredoxin oxidoreductase family protein [Gammaproteobacteria bacterium]|nr:aldehyde ferredoxin oxidoreductase family protein [Gammaproteobacteria bacterium]